jgi:hypothetical protein
MLKPQRIEQDLRIIKAVVLIWRGKEGGDAYAELKPVELVRCTLIAL